LDEVEIAADVVISDYFFERSNLNGIDVLKSVRKRLPHCLLILHSNSLLLEDQLEDVTSLDVFVLGKPFEVDKFHQASKNWFENSPHKL